MNESGEVPFGNTVISYRVVRSARRKKTIEITMDPSDGVVVAAPLGASAAQIQGVVKKRASWIIRTASEADLQPRRKEFVSGESLPYLGREVRLFVERSDMHRVKVAFDHWSFRVVVPSSLSGDSRRATIAVALEAWYRRRAAERLRARVAWWSVHLQLVPPKILIRDQHQRWASCSQDGTLRFNWRIVMTEPALIDYVVAHELVHLHERTHSARFWNKLGRVMPDNQLRRAKLKEVGPRLIF